MRGHPHVRGAGASKGLWPQGGGPHFQPRATWLQNAARPPAPASSSIASGRPSNFQEGRLQPARPGAAPSAMRDVRDLPTAAVSRGVRLPTVDARSIQLQGAHPGRGRHVTQPPNFRPRTGFPATEPHAALQAPQFHQQALMPQPQAPQPRQRPQLQRPPQRAQEVDARTPSQVPQEAPWQAAQRPKLRPDLALAHGVNFHAPHDLTQLPKQQQSLAAYAASSRPFDGGTGVGLAPSSDGGRGRFAPPPAGSPGWATDQSPRPSSVPRAGAHLSLEQGRAREAGRGGGQRGRGSRRGGAPRGGGRGDSSGNSRKGESEKFLSCTPDDKAKAYPTILPPGPIRLLTNHFQVSGPLDRLPRRSSPTLNQSSGRR
eukprot:GHVT01063843.1.p1 GENE.GHVT01063843.1~~GHVT01063843.1.p1  ORF type:complete len:372 (+),score=78.93 GHVT01063843.1:668-1783(+)